MPEIPGVHLENIFTLHGIEHAEGIKSDLAESRAKDVTIVGGGLIGVEMTESLVSAGCRVTLVEMRDQLLPQILDREMAELVRAHFESKGVRVMLNTPLKAFVGRTLQIIVEIARSGRASITVGIVAVITLFHRRGSLTVLSGSTTMRRPGSKLYLAGWVKTMDMANGVISVV